MKHYINPKTGHGPFHRENTGGGSRPEPNILFVSMDMVPSEFHLPGNTLNTPCQKGLAEDGVHFAQAYAASPLCGPSRASFLTGRYSYITGNTERSHDGHAIELREDDIIWPEYLKASGYHCRHVGKSHVGTRRFLAAFSENSSPWDRWSPPWYDEDAYVDHLHRLNLGRFSFKKEIRGKSWDRRGPGNSYGGWLADQNGKPFPEEALYPTFLVNRAITTLKTRQDRKKPFYLQLDFFGPHQPFAIPGGWEEREREIRSTMTLPDSWEEWAAADFPTTSDDPRVYEMYRKNWGLLDRETLMDYKVANQLQYEILDRQLCRLITYLKENDLYDNTCIFFIADHGEMNGRKGCIDKGAYLNSQTMHVPLIMKPAASARFEAFDGKQGSVVEQPVSLLDLFPTVCDVAGITTDARTDGCSLFRTLDGEPRPEEKPIMFDVWNHVVPNPCVGRIFGYKGGNYLYSYNCTDYRDEIYDISDPGRLVNLYGQGDTLEEAGRRAMHSALSGDARWDVYNCYFQLENADNLNLAGGDSQKFE